MWTRNPLVGCFFNIVSFCVSMLSVEEAQKRILEKVRRMGTQTVSLSDALGRILAKEINAGIDLPPWDNSAMDGYAVCSEDTQMASRENPCRLTVVEEIPAGALPKIKIVSGTASKIMTGAPMPEGADAVIMIEESKREQDTVLLYETAEKGDFIRYRGEVVRQGDLVLSPGVSIRPYDIAIMASLGFSQVSVFQSPRVAILSTGNELVDLTEPRGPHQIYNSNGYGLAAQVKEAGGVPMMLGIAKDSRADLIDKLKEAADADFILISGGVSVGDYDFVKEVLGTGSGEILFWKIAMKPGKPLAFGLVFGKPTFGLPGNPVSAMVTFDQFVRPALLFSQGSNHLFRPFVYAQLMKDIQKEMGRRHFVRARLYIEDGAYRVVPSGDQDSANLLSFVNANAYIVVPEEGEGAKAGDRVTVQIIAPPSSFPLHSE